MKPYSLLLTLAIVHLSMQIKPERLIFETSANLTAGEANQFS